MRVLVFGPTGQLGSDVVQVLIGRGEDVVPVTREGADLTDPAAVNALLARERPDAVVNCAAFHDPAGCEENPELAYAVNAAGVETLARQCAEISAKLMTVSTDYVFDGTKLGGYTEEDPPNPLNRYGESKLAGEQLAQAAHEQTFIVRTQSLFGLTGPRGKGTNFVDLMTRLAEERDELKVDGFRMAPTGTVPLAENMHTLLLTNEFGLYHMSCQGETTWYEFATAILERLRSAARVTPVPNDFYATTFRRPENTYLINAGLQARGIDHMPPWEEALEQYLKAKGVAAAVTAEWRILIVGGAGYVGSSLIPALLERGYGVDVVDVKWFGVHLPMEVSVVDKDILSLTTADLEGYEQVIFLAGLSNDPMAEFDPAQNFQSNGAMPSYLAYLAKQVGVRRVIYASSCSVYGYTVNELYDEDAPAISSFPYGISKLQGEQGVLQMQDEGFSTIALRKGTICGYSPRMRFDLIVNTMYKSCIQDGKITVNNPSLWRPILDIRDAVSAYLRAIQADYSISGIFNVASDNYTVGQVGDKVKEKMENLLEQRIKLDLKNIQDFRNYKVDCSKARTVLGFEPSHDVSDIVDDLHAHRDLYGDLDSDDYYNIRVFQMLQRASSSDQQHAVQRTPR